MIKVMFICHGNICRSPMAEFVMKDIMKKAGMEKEFDISSAATSTEELGNSVSYPYISGLHHVGGGVSCFGKMRKRVAVGGAGVV